ncbi:putative bifunctional diguanylate cyclase/phosphodiesterase [Undibacterium terreum]|uniref:EAL domain-containing protein n=1 Tax=Undibacterium terreum TaxID=1224302 RepID=A0A916UIX6_9BURK|nr:EAL domain-containing protein [Undibacterium terreum]GGC75315.1 hypothetical protein GCM10011396_23180 [Undibacterium terreum]
MTTLQFSRDSLPYRRAIRHCLVAVILCACFAITWMSSTDGIVGYAIMHVLFIPVLIAAFVYGIPGGLLIALACGIAIDPLLALLGLNTADRGLENWLYQVITFVLIGGLGALANSAVHLHWMRLRLIARLAPNTGLPNAHALLMALEKLAGSRQSETSHVLGVVTVYNSDEMSSAFGFCVLDDSMRKLAICATGCLPAGAAVFRIGTEQLGFLSAAGENAMSTLLARLNTAFRQPLMHQDQPIHADTRIGYVAIHGFLEEPESYLRKALAASLQASQSRHDISLYRSGMRARARDNLTILGELIGGMEREEVYLHYQPKVSLSTGAVVGVEALIRWKHPQRGLLQPATFIPRAEQSTLIHALTEFAIERALHQAVAWRNAGMMVPIAVNVSPQNLMQPGFCNIVQGLLARCGGSSELLELEVTEGSMVGDIDLVAAELHQLNKLGVQIAIDDFGTGYSSLTYLDRLPVSILKIDQSFIRRMFSEESSIDIVDAVVSVAHKKGVRIVAEGVESQAVFDILKQLGCDVAQGYGIGKPMPPAEFEAWYRAWQLGGAMLQAPLPDRLTPSVYAPVA